MQKKLPLGEIKLTVTLIVVSVIVTLHIKFGGDIENALPFFISTFPESYHLPEIRHGQIWRLWTPMFMHFHILHLAFNMLWTWDLGKTIEVRQSNRYLLMLTLIIGAVSNLAQFYYGGPKFGGMSGVVYGLLGYIWVQGHLNPRSGLFLHKQIAIMIMVWYLICWTGLLGPVANMAHTAGLLGGVILGGAFALYSRKHQNDDQ